MSLAGSVRGRSSITRRLTLLFASASIVVLLLLGTLIGRSVEQHFVEQDMEILTGKLDLTRHALEKVHASADLDSIPQQLDDSETGRLGNRLKDFSAVFKSVHIISFSSKTFYER